MAYVPDNDDRRWVEPPRFEPTIGSVGAASPLEMSERQRRSVAARKKRLFGFTVKQGKAKG